MEEGEAADGMYFVGIIDEVRLSVMTAGTPARGEAGTLGRVVVSYTYNARNQLVTETSGASVKTYSYDRNGNVLSIVETVGAEEVSREEMTYDPLNRMLTHTGPKGTEAFTYRGAEWHRLSQDDGANGTQFLYDGDNVLADTGAGGVEALYVTPFLDQNLSITSGAGTHYYSQDGLGSVRTLTDASGILKNRYDYLPFGSQYSPATTVSLPQRYTYTSRELNPTSDLMYYRYRQYDPRVGRFDGRDPAGYSQGPSLFAYVHNASILRTDAYGLGFCGWGETYGRWGGGDYSGGVRMHGKWRNTNWHVPPIDEFDACYKSHDWSFQWAIAIAEGDTDLCELYCEGDDLKLCKAHTAYCQKKAMLAATQEMKTCLRKAGKRRGVPFGSPPYGSATEPEKTPCCHKPSYDLYVTEPLPANLLVPVPWRPEELKLRGPGAHDEYYRDAEWPSDPGNDGTIRDPVLEACDEGTRSVERDPSALLGF